MSVQYRQIENPIIVNKRIASGPMSPLQLSKMLKNIGPTMAQKLVTAGIDTPEKLKKIGAKKAYLRIHQSGGFCGKFHAGYLYALEGAITDCDWLKIPENKKREYKSLTEELRQKQKVNT